MSGPTLPPDEKNLFRIVSAIRQLAQGRTNANGTVTLNAGATTTTVSAPNCAAGSAVLLFPATAHAAAIAASTYVLASNVTAGQFIITHPSDANTDKAFYYVALG